MSKETHSNQPVKNELPASMKAVIKDKMADKEKALTDKKVILK
jgi:hypothetical protein